MCGQADDGGRADEIRGGEVTAETKSPRVLEPWAKWVMVMSSV